MNSVINLSQYKSILRLAKFSHLIKSIPVSPPPHFYRGGRGGRDIRKDCVPFNVTALPNEMFSLKKRFIIICLI